MTHIYLDLAERLRKKKPSALAVILEAKGSAPQRAGAAAIFSASRLVSGTVGGGSLEGRVFKDAAEALKKGRGPRIVSIGLKGVLIEGKEPICGGSVKVLIDPCPEKNRDVFLELADCLEQGSGGVLSTSIRRKAGAESGKRREGERRGFSEIAGKAEIVALARSWIRADPPAPADKEIGAALADRRAMLAGRRQFLEPLFPPSRLIIAGAGHIGRAVSHLGRLLDFDVTVIDDRREFANPKNLPDADHIVCGDIRPALEASRLDGNTYVVIVTRGHEKDAEALRVVVNSGAAYIGMIGSRTKIALERKEFIDRKWATADAFDRVHAPIGLPIRSQTVQEIAVSIAAELVLARRRCADLEVGSG